MVVAEVSSATLDNSAIHPFDSAVGFEETERVVDFRKILWLRFPPFSEIPKVRCPSTTYVLRGVPAHFGKRRNRGCGARARMRPVSCRSLAPSSSRAAP